MPKNYISSCCGAETEMYGIETKKHLLESRLGYMDVFCNWNIRCKKCGKDCSPKYAIFPKAQKIGKSITFKP